MHTGSFEATGTTVKDLITFAYAVPDEKQLTGGPGWMRTERFDLKAKIEEADIPALKALPWTKLQDQMRLRLQVLLEQRFKLQILFAKKELPLLVLEVAKGGSKCKKVVASNSSAFDHIPPPPPPEDIHRLSDRSREAEWDAIHWTSTALPFPLILSWISAQAEVSARTVVDRTGLDGGFDCEITWKREKQDPVNSSFFTALREQMGLRLRPECGAVETLAVAAIDRPSAN